MDTYFIDYDLKKKNEHDYTKLWAALKEVGAVRMLQSLWAVKRNGTSARLLYDRLKPFTHASDALSVSKVIDWAMLNTEATPDSIGPKTTK